MGRKRKEKFVFVCEDCGRIPEKDEEHSTEMWEAVKTICPHCGGNITIKLVENK